MSLAAATGWAGGIVTKVIIDLKKGGPATGFRRNAGRQPADQRGSASDSNGREAGSQEVERLQRTGSGLGREPMSLAYFFLLAFMVLYCARPEDFIPLLHYIPLAKIAGALALLAFVAATGSGRLRWPREATCLALLLGWLFLGVPFASWRGGALSNTLDFGKNVLFILVMISAVNSMGRLRRLMFVQTICVGLVAIVSVARGALLGHRLSGVLNGPYGNPNDFAFTIVLTLPFCLAFALRSRSGLITRLFWWALIPVMVYSLMLTASRAGLLALLVTMAVALWEFGVKGRRFFLILAAIVGLTAIMVAAGTKTWLRFEGTFNPSENYAASYGSAEERRQLLNWSIEFTERHPLFGIGLGDFPSYSGHWKDTHNSYTEMSCEGGLPALMLYLLILFFGFANVRRVKRGVCDHRSDEWLIAVALRAALWGYLIGSFFASVGVHLFPYLLIAYTSALLECTRSHQVSAPAPRRSYVWRAGAVNATASLLK